MKKTREKALFGVLTGTALSMLFYLCWGLKPLYLGRSITPSRKLSQPEETAIIKLLESEDWLEPIRPSFDSVVSLLRHPRSSPYRTVSLDVATAGMVKVSGFEGEHVFPLTP